MKVPFAIAALAVMLLAIGSAEATCRYSKCPPGYVEQTYSNQACPTCVWGSSLQCGTFLSQPYCCGGDSGVICPAIACTKSSSFAISGTNGCAKASSTIKAVSISESVKKSQKDVFQSLLFDYCSAEYPDNEYPIALYTTAAAEAYAVAVSTVIADWSYFVCTCGLGCSPYRYTNCNTASTTFSAQVQAVAKAEAYAVAAAVASVTGCFEGQPQLLALAAAEAEAMASATEVAILEVYKSKQAVDGQCYGDYSFRIRTAIAKAVACAWVNIFASARDACTPDVVYSCSADLALSGSLATYPWQKTCRYKVFGTC